MAAIKVVAFLLLANCLQQTFALFNFDPQWETLRVTFGLNLFNKWTFAQMPLTKAKAEEKGFSQVGNQDSPCSDKFNGFRYALNDDPALILLYDKNGYIAGIQTSFPENLIHKDALYWYKQSRMFTHEDLSLGSSNNTKHYTLTAYLVDPSIICTTGRSQEQFDSEPGGTDLYLKNGPGSQPVPKKQSDLEATSWTKGKCFRTMGVHYWYNTSKDMNCDNFQPVFLMYNHGKLTGFGWASFGMFTSPRYEHPTKSVFSKFFEVVPDCLNAAVDQVGAFSTMHVYMNVKPWNLLC